MEIVQSIILGVVQGIAEFLPISSSGHLILIPNIFGWEDQGLGFDVALHWGTLIAVIVYFWKDWVKILKESYLLRWFHNPARAVKSIAQEGSVSTHPQPLSRGELPQWSKRVNTKYLKSDLLFIIIIATIPGIIVGLLLNNYAETVFRDPLIIATTLSIGAILLFYSDKIGTKKTDLVDLTLKMGIIIGLFQALAIIPGVSRSGITITVALFLGMKRTTAARFSFLLSTPIILGAGIMEFPNLIESDLNISILVGVLTAATSGYLAIKYMLKYLENRNYNIFVWYRLVLAVVILFILSF